MGPLKRDISLVIALEVETYIEHEDNCFQSLLVAKILEPEEISNK